MSTSRKGDNETTWVGWIGFGLVTAGTFALFVWLARRPVPPPNPNELKLLENVDRTFSVYWSAKQALETAQPTFYFQGP